MANVTDALAKARPRIEAKVLTVGNTVEIRDLDDGKRERTFDEETGTYKDADGVADPNAYAGLGAVTGAPQNRVDQTLDGPVAQGPARAYEGFIPLAITTVTFGMVLKVTGSTNDPGLVGRFFVVDEVLAGTFELLRRLQLTEIVEGDPRWGRW